MFLVSLMNYLGGYSSNYVDNYKKVLEFIPSNKEKISDQNIDTTNILFNKVAEFVKNSNKNRFIVSLSGGVDSMVLTTILKYLKCEVIGVHINYNNRNETKEEQKFLEKWCNYNGIKLYVKAIEDCKRNNIKRSEYEVITKKIRFDFYKEIMAKENIDQILLGHHKDDIVENIFANVCRGRNILDLAVIRDICTIEYVNIARPMLDFYKDRIFEFATIFQVPYFKDTTPVWSVRGKYRNKISPLLEDTFTNNVKENLIGLSHQSDEWNELVQSIVIEPFMNTIIFNDSSVQFNVENYNSYPISFWSVVFSKIFFQFGKSCPSRKAIQVFMNAIKTKNVSYISISNSCVCYNKNYNIKIEFKLNI
jgi:tRNA(Ile)-lysidine synthetase-like protein